MILRRPLGLRRLRYGLPLIAALSMAMADEASAATCTANQSGDWHTGTNWSCGHVPLSTDDVQIGSLRDMTVSAAATAASLTLTEASSITFSGNPTLAVGGAFAVTFGMLSGSGTTTVGGTFSLTTATPIGLLTIHNGADLILNGDATVNGGAICLTESGLLLPTLHINGTFTIGAGAALFAFPCGGRVYINPPSGHLVNAGGGTTISASAIYNDDTITVQAGTLTLLGGGTSAGAYLAEDGATLEFYGLPGTFIGASGRLGGTGTVHVNAFNVTLAAGAVLDPAVVRVTGTLVVDGSSSLALPTVTLTGGTLNTDRPLTAALLQGSGRVRGNVTNTAGTVRPGISLGTLTVDGSYTQGAGGTLETEIAGTTQDTQYDRLVVTGSATLAGTLAIINNPRFDPAPLTTFEILSAASRSGTFSTVIGAQLSSAKSYGVDYSPAKVNLRVLPPGCTIAGTVGNDVLVGTAGKDVICGLGGNDTIRGLGGNDTLHGAGGNDKLIGGRGNDTVLGGTGNDTLTGSRGKDVLKGQGGRDLLLAKDGAKDTVHGGPGRDTAKTDRIDRRLSVEKLV